MIYTMTHTLNKLCPLALKWVNIALDHQAVMEQSAVMVQSMYWLLLNILLTNLGCAVRPLNERYIFHS